MSGYTFRRAVREQVPLIIGLSGGTGSGKTFSAMRMAKGMSHSKPFCVIDTENGRASHYADQFTFDVLDMRAPFAPEAYAKAIQAADQARYQVIVVDSMSHVWAGDGGVLDQQEDELTRMAGADWQRREACKMAAWIKPKMAHKHMMQTLLQVKAHLILCFRAEEKIEMAKGKDGKLEVRKKESLVGKDGWVPICEKNVPFEATCSFLLLASNPGKPHPIKLQEQHKFCFKPDQCIDEFAGEQLAKWAKGSQEGAAPTVGVSEGGVELKAPATSPAPSTYEEENKQFRQGKLAGEPAFDNPAEPYRKKIKAAQSAQDATKELNATPEELRQYVWKDYQEVLKSFSKKK